MGNGKGREMYEPNTHDREMHDREIYEREIYERETYEPDTHEREMYAQDMYTWEMREQELHKQDIYERDMDEDRQQLFGIAEPNLRITEADHGADPARESRHARRPHVDHDPRAELGERSTRDQHNEYDEPVRSSHGIDKPHGDLSNPSYRSDHNAYSTDSIRSTHRAAPDDHAANKPAPHPTTVTPWQSYSSPGPHPTTVPLEPSYSTAAPHQPVAPSEPSHFGATPHPATAPFTSPDTYLPQQPPCPSPDLGPPDMFHPSAPPQPTFFTATPPTAAASMPSTSSLSPDTPPHEPFSLAASPVKRTFPASELYPAELRPMLTRHRLRRRRHRTAASMLTGAALAFGVSALRPWAVLTPSSTSARDPTASSAVGRTPAVPNSIAVADPAVAGPAAVAAPAAAN